MARPSGHGPGWETRRQEIIDQAAALFAERGYPATSIAEIVQAVGVGKGTLYYYIGSKEELLVEIQDRVVRPLILVGRRIEALDEHPLLRLRLLSEMQIELMLKRLDHIWVYEHDHRYLTGMNLTRLLAQRHEYESIVSSLIQDAIDIGVFRPLNLRLAMLQFLNLHNHTYQWVRPDGGWSAADLSREYCVTLSAGLGGRAVAVSEELEERVREFRANYQGPSLSAINA
jgi:AcrR family transcriptional regulator